MKASEIVAAARSSVGTPYHHQGRVNGVALDCAGVPVHVARSLGIPLDDFTSYGRLPTFEEQRAALDKTMKRVRKEDIQLGDLVWLRMRVRPQHFGIIADYHLGGFSLIHADDTPKLERVVEHRLDLNWLARIVAVWRYPGVTQ